MRCLPLCPQSRFPTLRYYPSQSDFPRYVLRNRRSARKNAIVVKCIEAVGIAEPERWGRCSIGKRTGLTEVQISPVETGGDVFDAGTFLQFGGCRSAFRDPISPALRVIQHFADSTGVLKIVHYAGTRLVRQNPAFDGAYREDEWVWTVVLREMSDDIF